MCGFDVAAHYSSSAPVCLLNKPSHFSGRFCKDLPQRRAMGLLVLLPKAGLVLPAEWRRKEQFVVAQNANGCLSIQRPVLARAYDRLWMEGTEMKVELRHSLLGWMSFGVATLAWSLLFVYYTLRDSDDGNGLEFHDP
eukprot:c43959_g1_i1 orf=233-646(+)